MEIPSKKISRPRIVVDLKRPVADNVERESPPPQLVEALAKLTLYRMQERVRREVGDGQIDKATKHLHFLATHLLSQGDRELAHTVLVEAEHIQQSRRFSKEGDKRIKYGTRALLLPPGPEQKT
jgi:Ca-activated chloride channel family protein